LHGNARDLAAVDYHRDLGVGRNVDALRVVAAVWCAVHLDDAIAQVDDPILGDPCASVDALLGPAIASQAFVGDLDDERNFLGRRVAIAVVARLVS
jgi:hypothetical protein